MTADKPAQAAPAQPNITIINQQSGGGGGFNPSLMGLNDKSPVLALLLSLFLVGTGQLYNGQILKGVVMFFGCIALWFMMLGWIINLWSIIDAYSTAKRMHLQWLVALSQAGPQGQVARA